jgi:hypothetical protein
MAVCLIFEGPGVTQAQYEQVRKEVAPGDRPPEGAVYHVAGPTENGWCVVEVWESEEALQRFIDEKLRQALPKAGITGQPRTFQVARIMQS